MITDDFLEQIAKAVNNESYTIVSHLAVGTGGITSIGPTTTQLTGEVGSREALSSTRTSKAVQFSAIRSGADVIDTSSGDSLTNIGIFSSDTQATTDPLKIGVIVSGITQTTNFDIEVITTLTAVRT